MKNPARSRSRVVKTRDGRKSTVQATPTLEEYLAAEERADAPKPANPTPREEKTEEPAAPSPLVQARSLLDQRPSSRLIRSSGENLPQTKCSACGKLAHEHPYAAPGARSVTCLKLVVFRDDDTGLLDDIPGEWEAEDEYDDLGYGEDDEAPTWLKAAGISRQEWEAEQQTLEDARERAWEDRRLQAETEALTEQWRSEVADKPADPPKRPGRRAS